MLSLWSRLYKIKLAEEERRMKEDSNGDPLHADFNRGMISGGSGLRIIAMFAELLENCNERSSAGDHNSVDMM